MPRRFAKSTITTFAQTVVTFEESPVFETDMARRIADIIPHLPWLVWVVDGVILGYAYATPWKVRAAYRHSVESSVYIAQQSTGKGLGLRLYTALVADLRQRGLHCVIGGAALPTQPVSPCMQKLGFSKVGEFREVGFKFGCWIDVAYWELML